MMSANYSPGAAPRMNRRTFLIVLTAVWSQGAVGQTLPQGAALGHTETGAAVLAGYLVDAKPCLPVKRLTADAGYKINVSPSRRSFMVIVGKKQSYVLERKVASIEGKRFELSVPAFERDGDFFVPLEFFEKAFPARFSYDPKKKSVVAVLPSKTLTVPIRALPPEKKK